MIKNCFMMHESLVRQFLSDSDEIKKYARTMTSEQMHEAVKMVYDQAEVHRAEDENLYSVDEQGNAHISVLGLLTPKASVCGAFSLSSETEYGFIQAATRAAEQDDAVAMIVYDIDSGGGYVSGVDETAQLIAGASKPTRAVIHNLCASAAYWLASQCDTIVAASPAAEIGSIGVVSEEYDEDEKNKREGVEHRIYTSSHAPEKRPDTKTDEGRAVVQKQLDAIEKVFVDRVAQGRQTTPQLVYETFGQGGLFTAYEAERRGMIDSVEDTVKTHSIPETGSDTAAVTDEPANKKEGGQDMTFEEFKAANPEEAESFAKAQFAAGVKAEQDRRNALNAFMGINAEGDAAVAEAVASGKSFEEANPAIQAAILSGKVKAENENAPAIITGENQNNDYAGVSKEDAAWYKAHGISPEDVKNYARK